MIKAILFFIMLSNVLPAFSQGKICTLEFRREGKAHYDMKDVFWINGMLAILHQQQKNASLYQIEWYNEKCRRVSYINFESENIPPSFVYGKKKEIGHQDVFEDYFRGFAIGN